MIIEISKISPEGSRYTGEDPAEVFELEGNPDLCPTGPIRYDLFAAIVSGGVVVRGRVGAAFDLRCGRCAEFFSTFAEDSDFIRDYPLREGCQELDLTDDLREAVLLRLPVYPVCRGECRGLCPRCGRNLNDGPCGCPPEPPAATDAWKALDGLKI